MYTLALAVTGVVLVAHRDEPWHQYDLFTIYYIVYEFRRSEMAAVGRNFQLLPVGEARLDKGGRGMAVATSIGND